MWRSVKPWRSPFLERSKAKGVGVLYMVDPIGKCAIQHVTGSAEEVTSSRRRPKIWREDEALSRSGRPCKETFALTDYLKSCTVMLS